MRKFIVLLVLAMFVSVPAFAINTPEDPGQILGWTGQKQWEPYKAYKLVRFPGKASILKNNQETLSKDQLVVYDVISKDGVTINTNNVSGDAAAAGIIAANILSPDVTTTASGDAGGRNWGYMQVHGPCRVQFRPGAGTSMSQNLRIRGEVLIASSDEGAGGYVRGASLDNTGYGNIGFYLGTAGATDTKVEVFLRAM